MGYDILKSSGSNQCWAVLTKFWEWVLNFIFFTVSENWTGPYQNFNFFHFVRFLDISVITNKITTGFKPGSPNPVI